MSADNPASNLLGGFKETGSAFRPCRQCLTTHDELQTMVCALHSSKLWTTLDSYNGLLIIRPPWNWELTIETFNLCGLLGVTIFVRSRSVNSI